MQFSLASLLLLTTAVAVSLGLGVWPLAFETARAAASASGELFPLAWLASMAALAAAVVWFFKP